MIRTQIQLTAEQARRVKALGREQGASMAEVIRRFIDRGLQDDQPDRTALYVRARRLVGRLEDPEQAVDLSEAHDEYLRGAFE
jgi:Ribbon-helix-helix protein, copG family